MSCRLVSRFAACCRPLHLAVAVPFLCSLVMSFVGPRPQTLANLPRLPSLTFDQYLVDLREVQARDEVFAYYGFHNTSRETVTINDLEVSCGCLKPQLRKKVYQPGESGEFLVRIRTAQQKAGPKEFSITVHYSDSAPRSRELRLRASFPEKQIYVSPMSLTMHQFGSSPIVQDFIVTDLQETPADILGVSTDLDFLKLHVQPPQVNDIGARQSVIRVIVEGPIPSGRHEAVIKVFTNDEKFSELKLPVQIFGPDKQGRHSLAERPTGTRVYGPTSY